MSDLPPIEYQRTDPQKRSGLRLVHYLLIIAIAGITLAVVIAAVMYQRHHAFQRLVERSNQVFCASNLRSIGQAIELYLRDNHGTIPRDLQALVTVEDLGLDRIVCPSSTDITAPHVDALRAGTCSYIYVGEGITERADPGLIVAMEDPVNHGLQGGNTLFGDGHMEFVDLPTMQLFLNELNAGYNPPRTTTPSMSQAAARQDYEKNWKARMSQLKTGVWRIPSTQAASEPE